MTTASGSSSSLPSTPQSLRRSSHSSTNSHGGSLNNIISPQERRGSKGIIKPSVQRTRIVTDRDHLQTKVGYSNYHFFDSCSRPGFVFIGSSGHVIAECSGHPSNNKIIVKTVREASDEVEDGEFFEEEFDEEKIYASQKLRTISLKFESLKGWHNTQYWWNKCDLYYLRCLLISTQSFTKFLGTGFGMQQSNYDFTNIKRLISD